MTPMTRQELARKIKRLPVGGPQETALKLAVQIYSGSGGPADATRSVESRRAYAGDPWAYFSDLLGCELTDQQEEALALIEGEDRVLLPAGNNLGKTFLLGGYGVYRMDAVAALPDREMGLAQQGARVLLPGPDHDTVFQTVYAEMLTHVLRAASLGHAMPGDPSERSVTWSVRPKWHVEVFTPPKRVTEEVAHTASGRHHRNQVALIEEGAGVDERVWKAAEGMCSSAGNKIISSFNPTEPVGPAYQRARGRGYATLHMDAFEHPNVATRSYVIVDAVDFKKIDDRVANECRDRGAHPETTPDEEYGDFLYALPTEGADEEGPRQDGVTGHPAGEVRVYRPSPAFTAQVRGRWPETTDTGLFDLASWQKAVTRWRDREPPGGGPDRVGVDAAREGEDESVAMPCWGETADSLLTAFATAQDEGPGALAQVRERRAYVDSPTVLPKGDGPTVAQALAGAFPNAPFTIDFGGGASIVDHLNRVMAYDAAGVWFSAHPPDPTPGEPWSENLRTALYMRAALLVRKGLVDVPDDPLLQEEVMAQRVERRRRTVGQGKKKERVESVQLEAKEKVKARIGRSPDRSDAFVLALHDASLTVPSADEFRDTKR